MNRPRPIALAERELELRRDIAEAFFDAQTPLEVYRLALARVTPLVNASFSSVFVRDGLDTDLLRLVCAHNWPQASARFLSQLRIRVGRGPTGRAVAEGKPIEAADVFADASSRDWWDPARELGFASLIALPLTSETETIGAVSFYYSEPHEFSAEERSLLELIAAQLSLMATRARRQEMLERENAALRAEVGALQTRVGEAEEVHRLKTEFLANISHELRTPLTSILGFTFLLLEGHGGPPSREQRDTLEKVDNAASVLLRMINDLLALTEIKLGRAHVELVEADAALLTRRAADQASPNDAVAFRVELPDQRIHLRTDPDKVLKILENLLSNSFKFTPSGHVVLAVRLHGLSGRQSVEWVVRDSGIGIPADQQNAIFDEFRQVDGSSTRLYGGSGLGLALSLQLAQLIGGDITLDSEVGRGSTFTLRLPVTGPPS